MLAWKKLSSAKWEDAWLERLGFVDPTRVVISSLPTSKTIRVEVYDLSPKEGQALVRQFGGKLFKVNTQALLGKQSERPPIKIRKELVVVSSEKERSKALKTFPERKVLLVPAAMAFGTGDHATTASCLRLLCDVAPQLNSWQMLDIGTGTGILAIAGRFLGASCVEASDFDPQALKAARENLKLNAATSITLKQADVLKWQPQRQWELVTANVFSRILIQAAPTIAKAVRPKGWLILSGILRTQESDCVKAFKKHFSPRKIVRKGKWATILAQKG